MRVVSDIVTSLTSLLDNKSGTCTVSYSDGTSDSGSALLLWDSAGRSLKSLCTFTPSGNKTVTSVSYSYSLCLGDISLVIEDISLPVIGNYSSVITAVVKLASAP